MPASPPLTPTGRSRRAFLRRVGGAAAGLAAGATVGPLAGCGRAEAAGDGGPVTLRLWTWALRPRFDDYLTRMVADFEATRPGVRVEWSDVAFDAMRRKVFAAGAAGDLPDVINFSGVDFPQFASLGALRPIGAGDLPGDPAGRFVAGALEACVIDGRLLGLPWYLSTAVSVMNAALLAEGGLTPQTVGGDWDTLAAQAGPFRRATGQYLFTMALGVESDLPSMMLADGLEVLVPDPATRLPLEPDQPGGRCVRPPVGRVLPLGGDPAERGDGGVRGNGRELHGRAGRADQRQRAQPGAEPGAEDLRARRGRAGGGRVARPAAAGADACVRRAGDAAPGSSRASWRGTSPRRGGRRSWR